MPSQTNRVRLFAGAIAAVVLTTLGSSFSFILNDATGLPIKWPPGSISIRIMADNSTRLSDGLTRATSIQAAMQDAQRGWNRYLGDAQLAPQILPAGDGGDGNGRNEIFFSNSPYGKSWDSNTLALTTTWTGGNGNGNERGEADIIFNNSLTWDSYRGNKTGSAYDIQRVALHELGHVLGLDHPDDDGQTVSAIMNSHVSNLDSLVTDDISGAQSLYGPPGVPANDNFANAITITLGNSTMVTVNGFNTNATKEAGEPNHAGNAGGHSVWWKWTAPSDGNVSVDTRGSYFDSTLAVYTGSALASLSEVASNDDINPGIVQASFVSFTAKANTTYWIAVDGFKDNQDPSADSAAVTLSLTFSPTGVTVPAITMQPVSITATAGNSASFTVTASGTAPLSYQWYFGSAAISGATSATYNIANAQSANAGSYFVTVSNAAGSVSSNTVTLTVNPGTTMPPPSSGGGGGGGGAPSIWFVAALSALGACRRLLRRQS